MSQFDKYIGTKCIVRAYSGVFFGTIESVSDSGTRIDVNMVDYRHIHWWKSDGLPRIALNVEDLAIVGAGTNTTISGVTRAGMVSDVKQIVQCSPDSIARFEALPAKG